MPPPLHVHPNGRFLTGEHGQPFFYLGDTAWELFHRLDEPAAEDYFRDRAAKGYNVVQVVVLAEYSGLDLPNVLGDLPFTDPHDPLTPNEAYFRHVDRLLARAAAHGLTVGLLPTWGDKWNLKWGVGPVVFTPGNARAYGLFLGTRYREAALLWILGGDRPIENETHLAIMRAMAAGIREGGAEQLMTFHPSGDHSSSEFCHAESWLDFNLWQTGHDRARHAHALLGRDYALVPVKPTMDGEPCYEDHPNAQNHSLPWLDAVDVRRSFYWTVFAGGCGFTYGCHDIWQFWEPGREPVNGARTPWREALGLPGASQVCHGRRLLESRPYFGRVPDQSLIVGDNPDGFSHTVATRDADGSYAMVYVPHGQPVTVWTAELSGAEWHASWFDPRLGTAIPIGPLSRTDTLSFTPPTAGPAEDWVLVLDDAARNFPLPGQGKAV